MSQHLTICQHYVGDFTEDNENAEVQLIAAIQMGNIRRLWTENFIRNLPPITDEVALIHRVSRVIREERPILAAPAGVPTSEAETPSRSGGEVTTTGAANTTTGPDITSVAPTSVSRADVRASAEKLLHMYLLPGSEREIILPQTLVSEVADNIEQSGRDDPEVFDACKDYVFQAMERDAYPGFLASKGLGNLSPPGILARLILAVIALLAGLVTAFVGVFLDFPRARRCWVSFIFPTLG
jgi:hypothetical protein